MRLKRLLAAADRHLLRRSIPHGLVSWRFLLPVAPARVRTHRRLWLGGRPSGLPLPLYLVLELCLWLHWVAFACWRRCWQAVRRRGAEIRAREGIGLTAQFGRLLALGLGHCVPPNEAYAFGLHRPGAGRKLWDHVFSHEALAFHHGRNQGLAGHEAALALIQDKLGLAELLSGHGIPTAPTLVLVPRGAPFDPAPWLAESPRLFCKPRHGSASRDTFVLERTGAGEPPALFAVRQGLGAGPAASEALRAAMARDDFLVQPFLANHPELAPLAPKGDLVTLRVITERDGRATSCRYAFLEVPDNPGADGQHCVLAVDPASGTPGPAPQGLLPGRDLARQDAILARLGRRAVPCWAELRASAVAAHPFLPGLRAIAWDFAITPTGAVMLEGNSGWATTVPQMLFGGLLRQEP